ncbi:MAG TPA: hypothetical protein VJM74_07580 [Nitrososphaeraceae archaeon]|nr:hypothetical protein [Nitrososphaeraceae archaeon]
MNYKAVPTIKINLLIAMIGAIIMISYGAIEAESSKSDNSFDWCYVSAAPEDRFVCLPNHENCNNAQSSDLFASSSCFNNKW